MIIFDERLGGAFATERKRRPKASRAAFDAAAHPRAAAGSAGGGQFVSADAGKGEAGGADSSKDKQDQVRAVQKLLGLKQTGTFSPADADAVRKYQKAHGLLVDGKVGGQTIASLLGEGKRKPGPMTDADRRELLDLVRAPAHKPAAKKNTRAKTGSQAKNTDAAKQETAPARRAMAHEQVGHTGKGLWGHKGWQLPAYIQHVANDLIGTGHSMSQAIQLAVGTIKNWAAGHDGKGNSVSAGTQAKAAVALAQWEKLKAKTKVGMRMSTYTRAFPLEEIRRLDASDGAPDGRTVEAYAAVFDTPAEIRDGEGHYREVIDRTAFNKTLADAERASALPFGCFYNHGLSIHGTPSERYSMPLGVALEVRADGRGLLTRTRYANTPLADEVLELIDAGAIRSQSFTGRIVRSDPGRPAGGGRYRPSREGRLPLVRRMELGLREYGPTPFPAYKEAAVVGVRAALLYDIDLDADDLDLAEQIAAEVEPTDPDTPAGAVSRAGEPLVEHSEGHHLHALFRLRTEQRLADAGLVLPTERKG